MSEEYTQAEKKLNRIVVNGVEVLFPWTARISTSASENCYANIPRIGQALEIDATHAEDE